MSAYLSKDLSYMIAIAILVILILLGWMFFSPLAIQFQDGLPRGVSCEAEVNGLVEAGQYQEALALIDCELKEDFENIPSIAYFDRFLPEEKRYEVSLARAEIYELQWKRIEILSAQGDSDALRTALKGYTSVIGYHQNDAKSKLKQLEER